MTPLTTDRLLIRPATADDADLLLALWTDPRVMAQVGYPAGLPLTRADVAARLAREAERDGLFDRNLRVTRRADGAAVGACYVHRPNPARIAATDIKLLPAHWGQRYGVEIKRALVDFLFSHSDCVAVEATPHIANAASIAMQEAVGGVRVGSGVFTFPPEQPVATQPVPHFVYHVYRDADAARRATLVLPLRDGAVLLGHKRRGFGAGYIVGAGGTLEPGETARRAAARELHEEVGLTVAPDALEPAARIGFWFPYRPNWHMTVVIFLARAWGGTVRESAEIDPAWFPLDALPLDRMWADAAHWLPRMLAGERLDGTFVFAADNATLTHAHVEKWQEAAQSR